MIMFLPLFPVLLIVMAVASLLWYRQSQNDIFWALGILTAVTGLAWGIVILHWSVQLIALVLLLALHNSLFDSLQSD